MQWARVKQARVLISELQPIGGGQHGEEAHVLLPELAPVVIRTQHLEAQQRHARRALSVVQRRAEEPVPERLLRL